MRKNAQGVYSLREENKSKLMLKRERNETLSTQGDDQSGHQASALSAVNKLSCGPSDRTNNRRGRAGRGCVGVGVGVGRGGRKILSGFHSISEGFSMMHNQPEGRSVGVRREGERGRERGGERKFWEGKRWSEEALGGRDGERKFWEGKRWNEEALGGKEIE